MNRMCAAVACLMSINAQACLADGGFTILYEANSWTVFRFVGGAAGDPPDYCSARSVQGTGFFELIGSREFGCLSAEDTEWSFNDRTGEVGFFVGSTGVFVDNGRHFTDGLQICADKASTDGLIDMIWPGDGATIDVYDDAHARVGSFPGSGRFDALDAWKVCRDGL